MSECGISLFRVFPVDGQDQTGIHPDEIGESKKNEKNERDKTNGRPPTPGQDKDKDKKEDGDENSKKPTLRKPKRYRSPHKELFSPISPAMKKGSGV